jgi:hypothetical protein
LSSEAGFQTGTDQGGAFSGRVKTRLRGTGNKNISPLDSEAILGQPFHGLGIDAVFKGKYALLEGLGIIPGTAGHGRLNNQRTVVHLLIHEMN